MATRICDGLAKHYRGAIQTGPDQVPVTGRASFSNPGPGSMRGLGRFWFVGRPRSSPAACGGLLPLAQGGCAVRGDTVGLDGVVRGERAVQAASVPAVCGPQSPGIRSLASCWARARRSTRRVGTAGDRDDGGTTPGRGGVAPPTHLLQPDAPEASEPRAAPVQTLVSSTPRCVWPGGPRS